jgi:hypothetical protein
LDSSGHDFGSEDPAAQKHKKHLRWANPDENLLARISWISGLYSEATDRDHGGTKSIKPVGSYTMRPSKGPNETTSPDLVNRDSSGGTCFNGTDSIGRGPDYERTGTSAFRRGGKLDRDLLSNKPVKDLTTYPSGLYQK